MAAKKRRKVASKGRANSSSGPDRQLKSVIWFAVSLFLMAIVFIKGENFWTSMHNVMFGIFGFTAYFYPFLLCFVAVMYALNKTSGTIGAKIAESVVLVMLIGALVDVCKTSGTADTFGRHITDVFAQGIRNGGFLGALLGNPIFRAFGKTGAIITISLLIFVFVMIITGTTLMALFKAASRPAKAISAQAESAYKARSERENAAAENKEESEGNSNLKIIKGFNVDIPVDNTSSSKRKRKAGLDEMQKKVIDSYYGEDEESSLESVSDDFPAEGSSEPLETALDTAASDVKPDKITVDMERETSAVSNEIAESATDTVGYMKPPTTLLNENDGVDSRSREAELKITSERLVETLKSFGVETRVVDISRGPTVTRYELQPRAGVKISKITSLADDIALNLATAGVRIEAPIPNKAAVGIEVPNKASSIVSIREMIESTAFVSSKSKLTVAMGRDIAGNAVVADIAKMPHGLIAGATGSGKSVCINSFIMSILYKATPDDVKLLMIDPKVVELGVYNGIPHLLVPVVTEPRKAAGALGWAVEEMEKRYRMFADRSVRDISGYNKLVESLEDEPEVQKMPHIVIIIDELADLMMTAPHEVEDAINRIAAKARAAGMHLLIATQRPSVDVITGVIKANIPTRIAFAVSSQVDSRTILDMAGAEKLLGRGDMLFSPVGSSKPKRLQGCFVSDEEVERVVEFVKNSGKANYDDNIMQEIERQAAIEKQKKTGLPEDGPDSDPMLEDAIKVVVETGMASTSLLQRKLKLGYARAARIVDEMEERGVVGPYEGSKPRKVLITREQLLEREAGKE